MSQAETTAQKKNAYNIRGVVSQAIFRQFIVAQGDEIVKDTSFGKFGRPLLNTLAGIATRAVMKDPRLNVVLKKN